MSQVVTERYHGPNPISRSARYGLIKNVFVAYSPRARRALTFYCERDYRHWVVQEANPRVVSLCEYPDSGGIPSERGRGHSFEFSLWTREQSGEEIFWDVPAEDRFTEDGTPLVEPTYWSAVSTWCQARGKHAAFVSPTTLQGNAQYIDNWRQALPYVQHAQAHSLRRVEEDVLRLLSHIGALPIADVAIHLGASGIADAELLGAVFHLLHQGRLSADLKAQPLSRRLVIEVAHG